MSGARAYPSASNPRKVSLELDQFVQGLRIGRSLTSRRIACAHCGGSAVVVIGPTGEVLGVSSVERIRAQG